MLQTNHDAQGYAGSGAILEPTSTDSTDLSCVEAGECEVEEVHG